MPSTSPLPLSEYELLPPDVLAARIDVVRGRLGESVLVLGHHYQKSEVLRHCDRVGDSFQLSAAAADSVACRAIVFCGVRFMAETADTLVNTEHKRTHRLAAKVPECVPVVLPDPRAGCSMADMATCEQVIDCWTQLGDTLDTDAIVPVTYVNSTAEIKAFCGRYGGLACTSTNAASVLRHAFAQYGDASRVLFVPDQHLGRNTALAMGIPPEQLFLWTPGMNLGEREIDALRGARVVLWNGFCGVHQNFTVEQIDAVRAEYPGVRVVVHPECKQEVVEKADRNGSTSAIIDAVAQSPAGTVWAVGTEARLVERLAHEYPDKKILSLAPKPSICETMDLITPAKLCRSLELIEIDAPEPVIRVPEMIAADALACLRRMLACV